MSAVLENDPGYTSPFGALDPDQDQPVLAPTLVYWMEKRRADGLPARADIDPVDIPDLLPHIGLIDVDGPPRRFRYRLVGSYMATLFGRAYQGTYLDESKHGRYREFLEDLYSSAVDGRQPILSEAVFGYTTDREVTIRRLILPLAETPHGPVNMLLFANTFHAPDLPSRSTPVMHLRMDQPFRAETISSIDEVARQIISVD